MKDIDPKYLAAQLSHPQGEFGIELANIMNESNGAMTDHAIEHMKLKTSDHVLELGHGNCRHLNDLLKKADQVTYTGLEISADMRSEAMKVNHAAVSRQIASYHLYNGTTIPFKDSSFNKEFSVNTLYFWKEPAKLLGELYRVLAPNGTLVLTFGLKQLMKNLPVTAYGFDLYDLEDVELLIAKTPFNIVNAKLVNDTAKLKTGEQVDREFATMVLAK